MDDDDSISDGEDDSFFGGEDDDSVVPESNAGEEVSDEEEEVMEVIMYSIPLTPESNAKNDGEVENLGFIEEKKVEDYEEREDGEEVNGGSNEVEYLKKDEEIRANSIAKGSEFEEVRWKVEEVKEIVGDDEEIEEVRVDLKDKELNSKSNSTSKDEDVIEDEGIEEIRADFAAKSSNSKVEGDNAEIRVNLAGKEMNLKTTSTSKDEESRVNFAATSSKLEAKSTSNVQKDNIEIETVKEDDKKQEYRANFATKEPKLKSKSTSKDEGVKANEEIKEIRIDFVAKSNSNVKEDKVQIKNINEGEQSEKIRANLAVKELKLKSISASTSKNEEAKQPSKKKVKKSSKSKTKSKFEEKVSMNEEECLIEMLKQMYVNNDDDEDVDFVETVKRRGITFPRNRGFDS